MPGFNTNGVKPVRPDVQPQHQQPETKLPVTHYQQWYGRAVHTFQKVVNVFRYAASDKPTASQAFQVYETFSHDNIHEFQDDYHRALHHYKVASAMEYHKLASLDEREIAGQSEIVIGAGQKVTSTEHRKALANTLKCSSTQLCYQFLAEGRSIPAGFLNRALLPYFEDLLINDYGMAYDDAHQMLQVIATKVGLNNTRDITFERILELKNEIRWRLGPLDNETDHSATRQIESPLPDPDRPALAPPKLPSPGTSRYHLDEDDKAYIQNTVDKGGTLKIPKHDLLNRLKRMTFRNKSGIFLNTMAVIISTAVTAVAMSGLFAGINLIVYLGWFAAWSGGTEAIRMVKVMRAMQKMERTADFAINPTDMDALKGFDENKFRVFMKNCRYVCSHETLTRIYNAYAELEKDVENSERLSQEAINTTSEAIRFEESKARYRYRKKNLDISFELFNRLYAGAIGDLRRMENEWDKEIEVLWEHKFQKKSDKERAELFKRAANDPRVADKNYHFQTSNTDWLKDIFPALETNEELGEIEHDIVLKKAGQAMREFENPDDLKEEEAVNKYPDPISNAALLIKSGVKRYIFGFIKSAFKSTVTHGLKVGWHSVKKNVPSLEITPQLPKISVDGLVIFGFFFVSDLLLSQINSGINNSRLEQMQAHKEGRTGINSRVRTGREEIATLRKLSKVKLSSFIDTLMTLHDAHKAIMEEMNFHKTFNSVDADSPPFSRMDDYEVAVLILRHKYYEQLMAQMTVGAIGQFHKQVQNKSTALSVRMEDVISA